MELQNISPDLNNPKKLTPDKLRKFPGLEHLTDEEATEDIETLEKLAAILLEFHAISSTICVDNQCVVHLEKAETSGITT